MNSKQKKVALFMSLGALLIIVVIWLVTRTVTQSHVTFTFDGEAQVTIRTADGLTVVREGTGSNSFNATLPKGEYDATLDNGSAATRAGFVLDSNKEIAIDFNNKQASGAVYNFLPEDNIGDIEIANNQLYGLNLRGGYIHRISGVNEYVDNLSGLQIATYNNSVRGLATSNGAFDFWGLFDINQTPYTELTATTTPKTEIIRTSPFDASIASFDVNTTEAYFYQNETAEARKLINLDTSIADVSINGSSVVVYPLSGLFSAEEVESANEDVSAPIYVYDTDTFEVNTIEGFTVQDIQPLSPNAYVVSTTDGTFVITDKGAGFTQLTPENIQTLYGNGSSLYYQKDDLLWRFDIEKKLSYALTDAPTFVEDVDVVDGVVVFLSRQNDTSTVYRVGGDQSLSQIAGELNEDFFIQVNALGDTPKVVVTTFASFTSQFNRDIYVVQTREQRKAAMDYLESQGINTSSIPIEYIPSNL